MYGVVLAGGSGTRFWPLSREEYPKQLLKIFGNQTLIQATLSRISDLIPSSQIYVVTNPQQAEQIRFQLDPTAAGPHFVPEPVGRNTAAAIGLAAIQLRKKFQDGVMVVLSADHFIRKPQAFLDALRVGEALANEGYLVTLGAKPTRPETGYGYIQKGKPFAGHPDGSVVQRFVEKPDRETAEQYLKGDDYFWNTGIFLWKVSTVLSEIKRFVPELAEGLEQINQKIGTEQESGMLSQIYPRLPSISIDYAVLEKSDRLAVIPTEMGWEDVGSWSALDEVIERRSEE
ncbi:MAG: mannose-1-phosphate guanylyltransferase, partial [Candidatus Manganitrophaceae bacterium]